MKKITINLKTFAALVLTVQKEAPVFRTIISMTLLILLSATTAIGQHKYDTAAIASKIRQLEKAESGAVVARDTVTLLDDIWADDMTVNTPYNVVASRDGKRPRRVNLYYERLDRNIEKLTVYSNELVMTMGSEVVKRKPPMTLAGQILTRRFTHVWMKTNGKWQLAIRHANFICMDMPTKQTEQGNGGKK